MIFSLLLTFLLFLPRILADDYPDTIAAAPLISIGTAISGAIEVSGDVDVFKIKLVAGRTYKITMQAISPPSPGFDDELILYNSAGSQVDSDDDSIGKNAVITYTAPSTGYYYIKAKAFYSSGSTSTGTYAMAAVDTTSCSPKCTGCQSTSPPSPCTICSSGYTCTSCSNTPSSEIIGAACSCAPGQNLGNGCLACPSLDTNCIQCSDMSTCTDCNNPLLTYLSTCVPTCPTGTYTTSSACIPCTTLDTSCLTCNSSLTCTGCGSGLVALGASCTTSCITGTYNYGGICTSCKTLDNYCTTCNSSITCTGCSSSKYALGKTCVNSCPGDTYINSGVCTSCKTLDDYCLTCNSSLSCTSCSSSKYGLGPSCVDTCPSDTYINSGVCTSCKTLNSECTTCNSSITCTGCLNSKYALGKTCVTSCPGDTYINSGICTSCKTLDNYCTTCNGSMTCTSCSSSKYALGSGCSNTCPIGTYIKANTICTSCLTLDDYCLTCNSSITCTSCSNSKYALAATCVDTCPGDTYINAGICTSCKTLNNYCLTCNSSLSCLSCSSSKLALGPGCVDSCPLGTFDNIGICTSCRVLDDHCQYCNSSLHCTSCDSGLLALGPSCVTTCPSGTFDKAGICTSCATLDDNCISCNNTITCLKCSGGLVALGQYCTFPCPTGTYDNDGLCTSCRTLDDYCFECEVQNFCSVCGGDKNIWGPHCVIPCPSSTNNNDKVCGSTSYKIYLSYTSSVTSYLAQFPSDLVYDYDVISVSTITLIDVDPSIYNYTMRKISNTVYQIDFTFTQSIPPTNLKLRYDLNGTSSKNPLTGRWMAFITTKYMSYLPEEEPLSTIVKVIKGVLIAATVGAGTIAFLGGNPTLLWPLLNLFQILYYLIFIDVNYPANVQIFLKIFSLGSLGFVPNPVEWVVQDINAYNLPVPGRYNEYNFSGYFLDNAGNELLLLGIVFLLYLTGKLMRRYLRTIPSHLRLLTNKGVDWFEWSGILKSLIASYMDTVQAIFLQLRVMTYYSKGFAISSVLTIIAMGFLGAMPIVTFMIIRKHEQHPEKLKHKFDALVNEYDISKRAGVYFVPIWMLKRIIMCLALVFFQGRSYVQIHILCAVVIFTIVYAWVFTPYPTMRENISNTLIEIIFLCVHIVIYILIHDDHLLNYTEEKRLELGWVIIFACGLILIIFVGLNLVEQFKEVIKAWKLIQQLLSKPDKKRGRGRRNRNRRTKRKIIPERYKFGNGQPYSWLDLSRSQLDISSDMRHSIQPTTTDFLNSQQNIFSSQGSSQGVWNSQGGLNSHSALSPNDGTRVKRKGGGGSGGEKWE